MLSTRAAAETAKRLVVSRPTTSEIEQMERGMRLHEVIFFELWETAMVLEPKTASLAAVHLDAKDIESIAQNIEETRRALGNPGVLPSLDVQFHALVAKGVHNRVLLLTREPMARLFYPALRRCCRECLSQALACFRRTKLSSRLSWGATHWTRPPGWKNTSRISSAASNSLR